MSKNKKRGMRERYQKSYDSKDAGGANTDVIDWGKVEDGVKFYKPKEGINKLIIVPYIIKTKNHPLVHAGDMEIGDMDYMMDLYVHRRVGPTEKDAICLKLNYGKACPLCDAAKEYRQKGDDESYKALKWSRRVYYNVLNARKMDAGLMVFSGVSHFLFEKEMIEEARGGAEGEEIIDFASVDDGCVVKFRGSMDSFGGNEFLRFKSFDFLDREEDLWDGIEEETVSFDEILILRDTKEMEKLLYDEDEGEPEEEEDEKRKKSSKSRKKKPEPEEEEDDEEKEERLSRKKSSSKKKRESEDEEEEDEEEEKSSKKSSGKKSGSGKKKKTPCPHGHTFGDDCDTTDECDNCDVWEECSEA